MNILIKARQTSSSHVSIAFLACAQSTHKTVVSRRSVKTFKGNIFIKFFTVRSQSGRVVSTTEMFGDVKEREYHSPKMQAVIAFDANPS